MPEVVEELAVVVTGVVVAELELDKPVEVDTEPETVEVVESLTIGVTDDDEDVVDEAGGADDGTDTYTDVETELEVDNVVEDETVTDVVVWLSSLPS